MDRFLRLNLSFFHFKTNFVVLGFAWTIGLILGGFLSLSVDTIVSSSMRAAATSSMSIIGFLSVLLLPLVLSAFVVCFSKNCFLVPIAFLKAILFSFVAVGVITSFGTAGWLVSCLLLFSDCLVLPLLWWFWLCSASAKRADVLRCGFLVCVCILLIGCFDYYTVAPFLASIILF